jgi:peptidoglycan/LPS O-acetylase OafA/YrhL
MFIPSRNAFGKIETFYGVGWTLNFEMMFYLLFSIALAVRLNPLRFVGGMLIILATASLFYRPDWPAIAFFAAPIVLNFLWGMVLAWLVLRGIRLPPVVSLALLVGGLLIFFVHPYFYGLLQLQFAAIVAGVIFLEPYIHGKMPCLLLFGGDASYSLYLIHPLVGVLIVLVCRRLEIVAPAAVLLAVIGGALLAATASYLLFEKPVTRFLRRRFQRREAWKATATGQHGG